MESNKKYMYYGIGVLIIIISLFLILKPSVSSKFEELFFSSKDKEIENLRIQNDSLKLLRTKSEERFLKSQKTQDSLILINSNLKTRYNNLSIKYNEAIYNYNRGDFNERYRKFSRLINGKDTLQ